MDEYIDGWTLAAQIRMERQVHKGAFLIVEGASDDRTLRNFIDQNQCSLVISFGKENAIEALKLLEDEGFAGVVCLVDADFDAIDGETYDCDSLIMTDLHDMDMMMFMSSAFKSALASMGDAGRCDRVHADRDHIRKVVLDAAVPLASVRWLSKRRNWRLDFKELDFSFISAVDLSCDLELMVDTVLANSSPKAADAARPILKSAFKPVDGFDPGMFCGGHDVMVIFGISLTALLGHRGKAETSGARIEAVFRSAYSLADFAATAVRDKLVGWEAANKPYKILQ